ncbi:RCC1 domain-containing protein [Streptomyces sp. NPDC012637]|uniref:RCC1 domain-containing protein n=1 Tax=Streptomyces sp. NPDC012637 TaxID=3364842 RepID=UPI0036EF63B3
MTHLRSAYGLGAAVLVLLGLAAAPAGAEPSDPWVRAWGLNSAGQLGNGSTLDQQTPSAVSGLSRDDVRELATGGGSNDRNNAVALLQDGTGQSWGGNNKGQLGDGSTVKRTTPVPVPALTGVSSLAGGYALSFAVLDDQSVLAWGDNASGQLGDGTTTASSSPVVALPPGSGTGRVPALLPWKSSYAY